MRILLTGSTGPIGRRLVARLAAEGHDLVVVARRPDRVPRPADADVQVIEASVTDGHALAEAARGCEACCHLAAASGRDFSVRPTEVPSLFRANVEGTRAVAEACAAAGVRRLVVTSTHAAGGPPDPTRLPPYVVSRRMAEAEAWRVGAGGLEVVVLAPGLVAGTEQGPFPRLLEDLAAGRFSLFPADTTIPVVGVDDVVAAHAAAVERGSAGRRYLLEARRFTWRQLADLVGLATRWPVVIRPVSESAARIAGQADAALLSRVRRRRAVARPDRLTVLTWDGGEDAGLAERELGLSYAEAEAVVHHQLEAMVAEGRFERR